MKVISAARDLEAGSHPVCVAIGTFDGVHLGHQQVIRQTVEDARLYEGAAVAVTFDRHPNAVVAPDRAPPSIYCLPQKLRALAALGLDATLLIHFDRAFSEIRAESFVRGLARDWRHLRSVCVGRDFAFGHRRGGNVALLSALGKELGFSVHGLAAVSLDGEVISSTRIREAIRTGNLDAAGQMLGRGYSLCGPVVRGDQLGHRLGYPTANLDVRGLALPPPGVYAAHARVAGREYRAVVNLGIRPTLPQPDPQLQLEAHLLDFDADLYGQEVELVWAERLREERRFASLAELKEQLARDVATARQLFEASSRTDTGIPEGSRAGPANDG